MQSEVTFIYIPRQTAVEVVGGKLLGYSSSVTR
jgi:hypothetical protein